MARLASSRGAVRMTNPGPLRGWSAAFAFQVSTCAAKNSQKPHWVAAAWNAGEPTGGRPTSERARDRRSSASCTICPSTAEGCQRSGKRGDVPHADCTSCQRRGQEPIVCKLVKLNRFGAGAHFEGTLSW